jgi:hypothetical protein
MKYSIDELVALARYYQPAAPWFEELKGTEHLERRLAANERATAKYDDWRAMLRRIQAQLPECLVSNLSTYLQARSGCDGPFWGVLELPTLPPEIGIHELVFFVSTLAPYYVIYCQMHFYVSGSAPKLSEDSDVHAPENRRICHAKSFEPTPEEEPHVRVLAAEIERTFGYEALPPEIGQEIVPDVVTATSLLGETTIYDCLFMGPW